MKSNLQVRHRYLVIALLITFSCSQSPVLEGFDIEKWQRDKYGCNKERLVLANEVMERKDELVELGQNEITAVLGKPNRHELYSRNKKAFVYFMIYWNNKV